MTRPPLITKVICGFVFAMAGLVWAQTPGRGGGSVTSTAAPSRVHDTEAEKIAACLEQLSAEVKTIKSELHKLQLRDFLWGGCGHETSP